MVEMLKESQALYKTSNSAHELLYDAQVSSGRNDT